MLKPDYYNRCQLHIACDSNTSVEIINVLLGTEISSLNDTLLRKIQRFGFLPLHVAIYRGLSNSVIKRLLDSDHDGITNTTKANCG